MFLKELCCAVFSLRFFRGQYEMIKASEFKVLLWSNSQMFFHNLYLDFFSLHSSSKGFE